jgi:signal transduction histidine kinase
MSIFTRPGGTRAWLRLTAGCVALGITESGQLYAASRALGQPRPFTACLVSSLPSWIVLAALVPGVAWLARRFPLTRRVGRHAPVHLAGAVVFSTTVIGMATWLSDFVLRPPRPGVTLAADVATNLAFYFIFEVAFYFAVVAFVHATDSAARAREREREGAALELRALRLEAGLASANLQALRMQLNPHFLFNTLNSVSVLALKGECERVPQVVSGLAELLRTALDNPQQFVTVGHELGFLRRYLEIEQVRFGDRLSAEVSAAPELLHLPFPSLVLQPLVENAIVHGMGAHPDVGRVRVSVTRSGERLVAEVTDSGPGFPEGGARRPGALGLGNTASRLAQLYGSEHSFEMGAGAESGARVRISIPVSPAYAEGAR